MRFRKSLKFLVLASNSYKILGTKKKEPNSLFIFKTIFSIRRFSDRKPIKTMHYNCLPFVSGRDVYLTYSLFIGRDNPYLFI